MGGVIANRKPQSISGLLGPGCEMRPASVIERQVSQAAAEVNLRLSRRLLRMLFALFVFQPCLLPSLHLGR